jgi:hypothetical protein
MEYALRVRQAAEAEFNRRRVTGSDRRPRFLPVLVYGRPPCRPENGDTWGPWKFDETALTLRLGSVHQIDLGRLDTPRDLLAVLHQVVQMVRGNVEITGNLIRALEDLSGRSVVWADQPLAPAIRAAYRGRAGETSEASK